MPPETYKMRKLLHSETSVVLGQTSLCGNLVLWQLARRMAWGNPVCKSSLHVSFDLAAGATYGLGCAAPAVVAVVMLTVVKLLASVCVEVWDSIVTVLLLKAVVVGSCM